MHRYANFCFKLRVLCWFRHQDRWLHLVVDMQHTCCTRWRRFACGARHEARPWAHLLRTQHVPHGVGAWPPQPGKRQKVRNKCNEHAHDERTWKLELFKSQAETPLTKYNCTGYWQGRTSGGALLINSASVGGRSSAAALSAESSADACASAAAGAADASAATA